MAVEVTVAAEREAVGSGVGTKDVARMGVARVGTRVVATWAAVERVVAVMEVVEMVEEMTAVATVEEELQEAEVVERRSSCAPHLPRTNPHRLLQQPCADTSAADQCLW